MTTIEDEIMEDWGKYKQENPTHTYMQFLECMTGVELANTILTHIPKSAYEECLDEIRGSN